MDSALALLSAVQTRLKADSDIQGIVGSKVYAAPPANPTYPFILITAQSQPFSTDDSSGMQHNLRVQSFAREAKPATVLQLRKFIFSSLDRQEDALGIDDLTSIDQSFADCFPEPDGKTYQSIIEFSVLIG